MPGEGQSGGSWSSIDRGFYRLRTTLSKLISSILFRFHRHRLVTLLATLSLCLLLASRSVCSQQAPVPEDQSVVDPDGTAHLTRVVPVPLTVSPEAQRSLAKAGDWGMATIRDPTGHLFLTYGIRMSYLSHSMNQADAADEAALKPSPSYASKCPPLRKTSDLGS